MLTKFILVSSLAGAFPSRENICSILQTIETIDFWIIYPVHAYLSWWLNKKYVILVAVVVL